MVSGRIVSACLGSTDESDGSKASTGLVGGLHRRKFHQSKKGGLGVEATGCGLGSRWIVIAEKRRGLPISATVNSARPGEILLVESAIESIPIHKWPCRLIGDKAYYSRPHRELFRKRFHLELIAPLKSRYRHIKEDCRPLRRMRNRWKIERLNAWLKMNWRLRYRREYHIENYQGLLTLACLLLYLRYF